MAQGQHKQSISIEFGLGSLLAILLAAADMNWWLRLVVVVVGLVLVGDICRKAARGIGLRLLMMALGAAFLLFVTWQPIWRDFHEKYPDAAPLLSDPLNWASVSFADVQTPATLVLVFVSLLLIGWGWHPIWAVRREIVFKWRRALGEASWLSREKALETIRNSRYAESRRRRNEKPRNLYDFAMAQIAPERDELNRMFFRWCELALENFARETAARRATEGGFEYEEGRLRQWLSSRYESDVIDEFGKP